MNNPNESPLNNRLSKMIRESRYRRLKRCKIAFIVLIAVFFIVMIATSQPEDEPSSKDKKLSQNQKLSSQQEKQSLRNAAKNYIKSKSSRNQSKSKSISGVGQAPPQQSVQNSFHQSHSNPKMANNKDSSHDHSNFNQHNKVKMIQQLSKKKLDTFKLIPLRTSTKAKSSNTFALNKNDIYSKAFGNKLKATSSDLFSHLFRNKNMSKAKNKTSRYLGRHKDPIMVSSKNASLKVVSKVYKLNSTRARNQTVLIGLDSKVRGQVNNGMIKLDQSFSQDNSKINKKFRLNKDSQTRQMQSQAPLGGRVVKKRPGNKMQSKMNRKGGMMNQGDDDNDNFRYQDELDLYQEQDPYDEEISRKTALHPKSQQSKHQKISKGNQRFNSANRQNKNSQGSLELDENEDEDEAMQEEGEQFDSEQQLPKKTSLSKTSLNRHSKKKMKGQGNQRWKQQEVEDKKNRYSLDNNNSHLPNSDHPQDSINTIEGDSDSIEDDSEIERLPTKKSFKIGILKKKTSNTTRKYSHSRLSPSFNQSANSLSLKKKSFRLSSRYGHKSSGRKSAVRHYPNRLSGRQKYVKKGAKKGRMPSVTRYISKDHDLDSSGGENWPWQMLRQPKSISNPLENHRKILRPTKSKTILIWSPNPNRHHSEAVIQLPCGQHQCRVVRDSSQYTRSSAVIFQNYHKEFSSFNYFPNMKIRPEGQLWIYHNRRSPVFNQRAHIKILRFHLTLFNLVMSHTHDADLIHHYGSISKGNFQHDFDPQRNYASGKSKLMAYYSSTCNDQTKTFLNHLRQFIPIDAYGSCGNITCSNGSQQCLQMIAQQYKFLLIMEDSLCRDYSTQQLYINGLRYDIVPVVVGGANYDDPSIAPPYSVINIFNFASGYELAKYLNRLDQDDTLYNHYFLWRLHYKVNKGNDISDLCGLCNNLYNDKWVKEKSMSTHYDLWNKWGDAENNCVVYPTQLDGQTKQKLADMYARAERHHGKYIL